MNATELLFKRAGLVSMDPAVATGMRPRASPAFVRHSAIPARPTSTRRRKAKLEQCASQAIKYLTSAIEDGPQRASTYDDLAGMLVLSGREEESAGLLWPGVEAWYFSPRLRKMLALRYADLER